MSKQYDYIRAMPKFAARIEKLRQEVAELNAILESDQRAKMVWMVDGDTGLVPTYVVMKIKQSEMRQLEIEALGMFD